MLQTFSIPHADIYSFTAFGKPWVAHEWLSEAIMYAIYYVLGWLGLIGFSAVLNAAVFFFVARNSQAPPQIILLATVICQAAALVVLTNPQPRLGTLLLSAVFFIVLRKYLAGTTKNSIWILPPLMVLWVNLHAGYPLGLLFILLAALALMLSGERVRIPRVLLVFVLSLIGLTANPNGVRMFAYPFETQFSAVQMAVITEWHAPNFRNYDALPFLFLILVLVAVLALSKRRTSWFDLLCLLLALLMSLRSIRHISVLSLIAIPILAEHSWNWISSTQYGKRISEAEDSRSKPLAALLVLMIAIVHLPALLRTIRTPVNLSQKPVAALKFIEEQNLPNNLFSTYEWNDYIIWNSPERKVFIDGRADMYGDEFLAASVRLYNEGENWKEVFERFGVRSVMLDQQSRLATLIKQSGEWAEVYHDQQAVVFTKR